MENDDWMEFANCLGLDPNLFFPISKKDRCWVEAKKVCDECVVKLPCLKQGLAYDRPNGVWGGYNLSSYRGRSLARIFLGKEVA